VIYGMSFLQFGGKLRYNQANRAIGIKKASGGLFRRCSPRASKQARIPSTPALNLFSALNKQNGAQLPESITIHAG